MTSGTLKGGLLAAAAVAALAAAPAFAQDVSACLITKTDTNPFFVKMKEGAAGQGRASSASTLKAYAGKIDGDNESQVAAVETCIADGAKGILIVALRHHGASSRRSRRPATPASSSSRSTRRSTRSTRPTRPSPPTTSRRAS